MRTLEVPFHGEYEISSAAPPSVLNTAAVMESRYVDLTQQHHDLDYMICALSEQAACDELLVARLKKRKLRLKDEIARVAGNLHATGIATASP
jgi:hypothetical protein